MIKRIFKNQRGVTLVELLAVVSILSIIIIAITSTQLQFLKTYKEVNDGSFQNNDLSFFLQVFSNQIHDAIDITSVDDPTDPNQTVSVTIVKEKGTPDKTIVFNRTDNVITYTNEDGNTITILNDVEKFYVDDSIGKTGVELDLKLENTHEVNTTIFSLIGTKG